MRRVEHGRRAGREVRVRQGRLVKDLEVAGGRDETTRDVKRYKLESDHHGGNDSAIHAFQKNPDGAPIGFANYVTAISWAHMIW